VDEYDKDTDCLQASRLIHTKTHTANAVQRVNLFTNWEMAHKLADGSLLTGRRILARMYTANAVQRVNLFTNWGMAHSSLEL